RGVGLGTRMKFSGSGMFGLSAVSGLVLALVGGVTIRRWAKQSARPSTALANARSTSRSSHEALGKTNACATRRTSALGPDCRCAQCAAHHWPVHYAPLLQWCAKPDRSWFAPDPGTCRPSPAFRRG